MWFELLIFRFFQNLLRKLGGQCHSNNNEGMNDIQYLYQGSFAVTFGLLLMTLNHQRPFKILN